MNERRYWGRLAEMDFAVLAAILATVGYSFYESGAIFYRRRTGCAFECIPWVWRTP